MFDITVNQNTGEIWWMQWAQMAFPIISVFVAYYLGILAEIRKSNRTQTLSLYLAFLRATTKVTLKCNYNEPADTSLEAIRSDVWLKYIEMTTVCTHEVSRCAQILLAANIRFMPPKTANEKAFQNEVYWKVRDDFIDSVRIEMNLGKLRDRPSKLLRLTAQKSHLNDGQVDQ